MKGITMCADCAYYNIKTHKCTLGCTGGPCIENGDDVRFFTDCPLPYVVEVWHGRGLKDKRICSVCKWEYSDELPFMSNNGLDSMTEAFAYCQHCGAQMDALKTCCCISDEDAKRILGGADNG